MNNKEWGKYLKNLREKKGLSQEKLADKLGYTRQNLSRWENGITFPTDEETIKRLSNILEISVDELLNPVEFKTSKNDINKKQEKKKILILLIILLIILIIILYFIFNQKIYPINIDGIFSGVYTSNFKERYLNIYTNDDIKNLEGIYLYTVDNNQEKYILKTTDKSINIYEKGNSNEYNLRYVSKCGLYLVLFYKDGTYNKYDYYLNEKKYDKTCDYKFNYENHNFLENYGFVKDDVNYNYTFKNGKITYDGYNYHLDLIDNEIIETVETIGEFNFLYERYNKKTGKQQDKVIEITEEKNCNAENCSAYEDYARFINFLSNVNK